MSGGADAVVFLADRASYSTLYYTYTSSNGNYSISVPLTVKGAFLLLAVKIDASGVNGANLNLTGEDQTENIALVSISNHAANKRYILEDAGNGASETSSSRSGTVSVGGQAKGNVVFLFIDTNLIGTQLSVSVSNSAGAYKAPTASTASFSKTLSYLAVYEEDGITYQSRGDLTSLTIDLPQAESP